MLDPTFRARTAHIVQFRSIGAERITDSSPQLAHRSRQFTAHDTLPYLYDPPFNRSKRADQTSKLPVRSQHSVSTAAACVPTSNRRLVILRQSVVAAFPIKARESLWLRTDFLCFSIENSIVEVVPRDHFKPARDKFGFADADGFRTLAQP